MKKVPTSVASCFASFAEAIVKEEKLDIAASKINIYRNQELVKCET